MRGGTIPKADLYYMEKGEVVVPAYKVKILNRVLRKHKTLCKTCALTAKQIKKKVIKKKK